MLTKRDIDLIEQRLSQRFPTKKDLSEQLAPMKKDLRSIKKDVGQIKKDVNSVLKYTDEENKPIKVRLEKIEHHLDLPTPE